MKNCKEYYAFKEKNKIKKKGMAIALATSIIAGNLPANLTYAESNAIEKLNDELGININENKRVSNNENEFSNDILDKRTVQEIKKVTLKDGKEIRVVKDTNNTIILQEFDTSSSQWVNKVTMGNVEIKEMKATDDGGYKVIYLDNVKADYFKYSQAYDKDSNKIGTEEKVGIEILTHNNDTLLVDLVVDKNNNTTTIKSSLEEVTVKEFIPTLIDYIGSKSIIMIGTNSNGDTSVVVVAANGKVINGDVIKDSKYTSSEYTEVRTVSVSEVEDEKFIVSGYAIKDTDPDKKDGFLMQFDQNGNKDSEVKIIPHTYSEKNDATINGVLKFDNGNIRIDGPNIESMYINSLSYVDNRPIKETLTLSSGKSYKVVKETTKSKAGSNDTNTFTVKSVNDIFEYEIATYRDVKDIKLVPGNNNQVIIAVSNKDNSTEVGIINTDNDAEVDSDGKVISKVVNAGKIEDSSGPILNIDVESIKVNSDGKISVTTTNSSTEIKVNVNNVVAGNPIDIIKPEPPVEEEKPEEKPPVEEENPVIESQKLYFNRRNPQDVVIKNVDFKGKTLKSLSIGTTPIDISEVKVTNDSIIIPKEIIKSLKIDNGSYAIGLGFSNGAIFVGAAYLEIDGRDVESTPTIGKQELSFDRNNPQDMVIKNVDFKGEKLKSISIGGSHIDISKVTTTENTIIIPKEFFINLSLKNGKYYVIFQFESGSASVQDVAVNISGVSTPVIKEQVISFNSNNPQDVVINNAELKGLNLRYIYINGKSISGSLLKVEADKIIIPANVLKNLGLVNGVYDISFKFLNGTTLLNTVYLKVTDTINEEKPNEKPDVTPPVEEEKPEVVPPIENSQVVNVDNGEKIVFDVNKPTNIKIVSSKLENKEVEYILVNGIKVTRTAIEGKVTRNISAYATEEYFTTSNGSITLSANLFEELNLDPKEGYNIGVGFADGSEIIDLVKLSVIDSSINNIVTPPVEEEENSSYNGNTSNSGSNSTINRLPNTGSQTGTATLSIFALISTFVGTRLFRKKK